MVVVVIADCFSDRTTDKARRSFLKLCNLGDDPILDSRDPDTPVGLKVGFSF